MQEAKKLPKNVFTNPIIAQIIKMQYKHVSERLCYTEVTMSCYCSIERAPFKANGRGLSAKVVILLNRASTVQTLIIITIVLEWSRYLENIEKKIHKIHNKTMS